MKSEIIREYKGEDSETYFCISEKEKPVLLIEEGEAGLHITTPEKGNFGSGYSPNVYIDSRYLPDIIKVLNFYVKSGTIDETEGIEYRELVV